MNTDRPTKREMTMLTEPEARQYCGPMFFTRSLEVATEENIITNGSFGLVDTGKRKVLVTCHHVWEGFQAEYSKDPNVKICLCLDTENPVYMSGNNLIDCDKDVDLATFDMAEFLPACRQLQFFNLLSKPPTVVKKDDTLFLIGFPGCQRKPGNQFIEFGRQPFGVIVSTVEDPRFQANVTNVNWEPKKFGGISGCPAFLVTAGRANEIQLAGFAQAVMMNHLFFVHANRINPDGTIRR
jgi:hypothetical protein